MGIKEENNTILIAKIISEMATEREQLDDLQEILDFEWQEEVSFSEFSTALCKITSEIPEKIIEKTREILQSTELDFSPNKKGMLKKDDFRRAVDLAEADFSS